MKIGFLLHLYQPSTQTDAALKTVVSECYVPLLKLIKANNYARFTLNVPLSLLELLDNHGYTDILDQLKELYDTERIELTGSAAYHPLLTKISNDFATKQIVLNEYALGYYFGQKQGFEGELSMMIKGIRGFFSPEMAISKELIVILDGLKYEWVAVDSYALKSSQNLLDRGQTVFKLKNHDIKMVARDTKLSNLLSFKRDADVSDILNYLATTKDRGAEFIIALDGEVFGHHNKEGIYLLESLLENLEDMSVSVPTISDIVSEAETIQADEVEECGWSTERDDPENKYPLWENHENTVQTKLWELQKIVAKEFAGHSVPAIDESYGNLAAWKSKELNKIDSKKTQEFLHTEILFYKSMHSDQFWWASNKIVYDKVLYSPEMVKNALAIYKELAGSATFSNSKDKIESLSAEIERQLS